jgi:hypothetical protein
MALTDARPGRNRPTEHERIVANLKWQLRYERRLRRKAEQEAARFQALLLAERVRKL